MDASFRRSRSIFPTGLYASLIPPLLWMTLLYFVPLAILMSYSVWKLESFDIVRQFNLSNFHAIFTNPSYRTVILRTVGTALGVTLIDILIALPVGYFIANYGQRYRGILTTLVILPLWSSYLVRVFAWKIILGYNGILNTALMGLGILQEPSSVFLYNQFSTMLTFVHVWLPFMILPVITAFEKLPRNLLEASADLNASPLVTFRRVILPLVMPGVLAGSINVFSLTMGDFITPSLVGSPNGIMLGNLISSQFGVAYNWPLGAAFALVVMLIVFGGLAIALRQGALD
ncbi:MULTISPECIES: ABC transporter permease [unclassified Leptolyngbya]|uniref:ABC transporter permease n=1 Tax=unclassified Leptolyngbya TaxID=2650499 RepID=UPI0016831800|nr:MULTISPECIES: ABC transporter permease [unclassified Leptolyngbya]MBD1913089.1 ABC transporter permease [Leptolyngbya sp. FACHB-8]MBD2154410.1 ABC transporter permease [Leptolyngbya sp. FACHB-16]